MAFAKLPTYSDEDLEQTAIHFLKERVPAGVAIPVPIDWLVESLPGVDLDCYPALRGIFALEGGIWFDKKIGGLLLCVDEDVLDDDSRKGEAHYRWTVAEQLAHFLIHRDVVAGLDGPDAYREFHNQILGTLVERNTKRLAAALLMPGEQLATGAGEIYTRLVLIAGTDNAPAVQKYLRHQLAERFKVSERAMGYRLVEGPMHLAGRVEESLRRGRNELKG